MAGDGCDSEALKSPESSVQQTDHQSLQVHDSQGSGSFQAKPSPRATGQSWEVVVTTRSGGVVYARVVSCGYPSVMNM